MSVVRLDDPALDVDAAVAAALDAVERCDSAVTLPPAVRTAIDEEVERTFGISIRSRSDTYASSFWQHMRGRN